MSTKITTGKVRFSYCTLIEPRKSTDGGKDKYSVTLLIPKTDKKTYAKIKEALKEADAKYREKNGAKSLPPKPNTTLHDGDGVRGESGEAFGAECKNCWVITVTTTKKPVIFDRERNEIDAEEVYSGCYGRAVINFAAYNHNDTKKGISAYLVSLQKLSDGEPLGGGAVASADDYDDDYEDDDEYDDLR